MTIITTISGRNIDLANPKPSDFVIRDIAHHLALINRFAGATAVPYSVAQHSMLVAALCEERGFSIETCFWGLLHDAHEAFLSDIPQPAKRLLFGDASVFHHNPFEEAANMIDLALARAFGMEPQRLSDMALAGVALMDRVALATEWRDLMPGRAPLDLPAPDKRPVRPMVWHIAEEKFVKTFNKLHALLPQF